MASGSGFGSASINEQGILYESGMWATDWKVESSNFRGEDNLVTKMESLVEAGISRDKKWSYSWATPLLSRLITRDTPHPGNYQELP